MPPVSAPVFTAAPTRGSTERGTRHQALDGLRGIAVLAVLLFHADVTWAAGGYLGVDVFFVLSGFLITALLLAELDRSAGIDLGRFWWRRVKRLMPSLVVLVVIAVAFGRVFAPLETVRGLRDDAMATLSQIVNWRFIDTIGHQLSGAVRSPFQHCWSLAIEAQFYLVWPLLVWAVARGRGRLSVRRNVGVLAGGLALASIIAMAALVGPGWDTQRVYYGTDTRAQALLVGAVLAALIGHRLTHDSRPASPLAAAGISVAGTLAAAGILVAFVLAPTSGHTMYDGWYAVVAITVAVLIAQLVVAPDGRVPALLSSRPLAAVGRMSYSLYLWHWPLFLVITEDRTGLSGVSLFCARVVVSFVAAAISYVLFERGVIERRIARMFAGARRPSAFHDGRPALPEAVVATTTPGPFNVSPPTSALADPP
jgi:peptidoglycan/LPS O-acetylase OafA/YrhL